MRSLKKQKTIGRYIFLRYSIIIILAVVTLILVVNQLITESTERVARHELNSEIRSAYTHLDLSESTPSLDANYVPSDGCYIAVTDPQNNIMCGSLPSFADKDFLKSVRFEIDSVSIRSQKYYYLRKNRPLTQYAQSDALPYSIVAVVSAASISSGYEALRLAVCIATVLIGILLVVYGSIIEKNISKPLINMCNIANRIGNELDFSEPLEYDGPFKEMDSLLKAYNKLIYRLETVMARQEQFNSDISHELRTPIAVIQAETQVLQKELSSRDLPELVDDLAIIQNQNTRMRNLIEQLLNISRIDRKKQSLNLEEVELIPIIESVCEDEEDLQEEKHIFKYDLDNLTLITDISLISIAIRNLVNNAVKYSPAGTTITISLHKIEDEVHFSVQDEGVGIPEDKLKRIFEYYYRADESRGTKGFGLGLTLAMKIAEYLGGTIKVESSPGAGSTFSLVLH